MRIRPYRTLDNVIEGAVITFFDISEIKLAKDALKDAEWKFKALFDNGPIGVAYHSMIYDNSGKAVDYRFIDANEKYIELTGVDPRGKTVTQAFSGIENDPFDWIGTFGHVARTGETIHFESYLQPNARWYDVVGYQYKPDHFVAAFFEITERKLAEEALRKANDLLRLAVVVRDANDAIVLQDMEGRIMAWNAAAIRMYGWSEAEALAINIRQLIPEDLQKEDLERIQQLSLKDILEPYRTQRIAKDGTIVDVWLTATALLDEAGQVYAVATTERGGEAGGRGR